MKNNNWKYNPKTQGSGIITCIPQVGICPNRCSDCFFQSGRSYLEPLAVNLPHIPPPELAEGRIVRMNDGNDSNVQRNLVMGVAQQFKDRFYNTAIPKNLESFDAPVVLTVNPGDLTDSTFIQLEHIPKNLMFVRVRVNTWNINKVVCPCVNYYSDKVPVVLTFMAYYTDTIPKKEQFKYEWKKRTLNSYWVLGRLAQAQIEYLFFNNSMVYSCGYKGTHSCQRCGNCIREYYNTKERISTGGEVKHERE